MILLQVATQESIPGIYQKGSKMDASVQSLIRRTLKKIDIQFGDSLTSAIEACIKGNPRIEIELVRKTAEVLKRLQDSFI
jgi:Holliday junction resolvasome RuvABC ATP-dependent DNA helicase subunit